MKFLYRLLYVLFLISFVALGIESYILGILPDKYLFMLIGAIVFLLVLVSLGFKFIRKGIFKFFLSIFELIFIIGSLALIFYLHTTNSFFGNINDLREETKTYYLLVSKGSNFKRINDLNDKNIGIFMENKDAVTKLEEEINFEKITLNNVLEITDGMDKVDGVFLNSAYYDLICDENKGFSKKVRIIKRITLKTESLVSSGKTNITKNSFNILISGIDVSGDISTNSRSDVNIIMTVNPKTKEILLTHIPRDYYVKFHGINAKDKLTHAGIYGISMSAQTIEDFLDIDIDYYFRVNFTTLIKVVDSIGGVDVYSSFDFSEYGYRFKKGINHLNGKEALMFSRIRHVLPGGDRTRGKHQEEVIAAILNKITSSEVLLNNYNQLMMSLSNSFQTNMNSNDMKKMIKFQLNGMPAWNINSISVDGNGSKGQCYSMPGRNLYVMIPDERTISMAHKYISGIINGQKYDEIN